MGARYYEPMLGRFMGVDSVGFDPNNIHSFNRYAYANNNPCKFVDPDGRIALLAVVEVLGIVTIGVISYASQTPERQARLRHALGNLFHAGSAHAQAGDEAKAEPTKDGENKGEHKAEDANPSSGGQKQEEHSKSVPDNPDGKVTVPSDKWWKDQGIDPHEIKDGQGDSRRNLGVDKKGNIWSVDRHGSGNPQYEGNVRDFR